MTALREGQFELGSLIFGSGTMIQVTKFEPQGYDVNVNDLNLDRSDEVAFGMDSITPAPIAFEMGIFDNFDIQRGPDFVVGTSGLALLDNLFREWRADEVRRIWNAQKMLSYRKNGPQRVIFGRPRKMSAIKTPKGAEFIPVVAEFMPVDVLSYGYEERAVSFSPAASGTYPGSVVRGAGGGNAKTWFKAYIEGPITNPKLAMQGGWYLEFNGALAAGKILEINSAPWLRRIVDSDSQTWSAKLINDSAYLDEVKVPPFQTTNFGLSGTGTNASTKCTLVWRDAYFSY